MFTTVAVQIPHAVLVDLLQHLKGSSKPHALDEIVTTALLTWLQQQAGQPPTGPALLRGYQWKMLFLPEGTCLRSWSHGTHNYARVVGDQIMHEGRPVTPNQFARSFQRTVRNAWRDLFIKRPGDKNWQLASRLRVQLLADESREEAHAEMFH